MKLKTILLLFVIVLLCPSQAREIKGRDLHELCQDFPLDSQHLRTKRQLPAFGDMFQQLLDYACFDGSLLSCGVTLVQILPTRFYMNANKILDDITGVRGPNRVQEAKLELIRNKIALMEAKIKAKISMSEAELRNLQLQERALQYEILRVFSVVCKHFKENMSSK